jgi:hypothetical protein
MASVQTGFTCGFYIRAGLLGSGLREREPPSQPVLHEHIVPPKRVIVGSFSVRCFFTPPLVAVLGYMLRSVVSALAANMLLVGDVRVTRTSLSFLETSIC